MWLFGYGSLMWDGWEAQFGCIRRTQATLRGHSRIFNKKSLERWGTRARPGLTLNLMPSGTCLGAAFEFDDARQGQVEDYLCTRETCTATDIAVHLAGETVLARTYIYEGPRLVEDGLPLQAQAAMILEAQGDVGSGYDYIEGLHTHLEDLGIDDPAVAALWNAVVDLKVQNG